MKFVGSVKLLVADVVHKYVLRNGYYQNGENRELDLFLLLKSIKDNSNVVADEFLFNIAVDIVEHTDMSSIGRQNKKDCIEQIMFELAKFREEMFEVGE